MTRREPPHDPREKLETEETAEAVAEHVLGLDEVDDLGDPVGSLEDLLEALEDESFPMDCSGLYYAIGDETLPGLHGERLPVRGVLDRLAPDRTFDTPEEVITALRGALELSA
jgi:hypothetical protein